MSVEATTPGPVARDWITLSEAPLPLAETLEWIVEPSCGAVATFFGTVRDHAEGRRGVSSLEYEAYEEGALTALAGLVEQARRRWPELGRIALHHRLGRLELCEIAVVVAVAAPHRSQAFEAARYCIDTLKATVPIWKFETWEGGSAWSACTTPLEHPGEQVRA
jgi:molybdopterin synthase catalytic subunit